MKLFSERYNYTKVSDVIIREQITQEIQNAICSCYDKLFDFFGKFMLDRIIAYAEMERYLWVNFLNQREGNYMFGRKFQIVATDILENESIQWYRKLDLVELTVKYFSSRGDRDHRYQSVSNLFVKQLNSEFERLNFAYRVVNWEIVEITSKVEIESIESCMQNSSANIKTHIDKALELYALRPVGEYRNSIKESISAVEACCRDITGKNDLGSALSELKNKGVIIPAVLKVAFEKLYAYTNQHDTGIRHALMVEDDTYTPSSEEALFMIVTCSAFINYLNKKRK